jgi:tetratricopeptide (TPR) repeat protein
MFQPWRIQLRQAEEALKADRLEEAQELLSRGDVRDYQPAKRLLSELAGRFAARGRRRSDLGASSAGWRDLETAMKLGGDDAAVGGLRELLVGRTLEEAERFLAAGDAPAALARLSALDGHHAATPEVRRLRQVALKVDVARRLEREGRFAQAEATLAGAVALRPDLKHLEEYQGGLKKKATETVQLRERLHDALEYGRWNEALGYAERLLEAVPGDRVAKEARDRAWSAVNLPLGLGRGEGGGHVPRESSDWIVAKIQEATPLGSLAAPLPKGDGTRMNGHSPHAAGRSANLGQRDAAQRFVLWIDGVGGYLVCEGGEIVLGQPVPGSPADVPILGDLSRQHATIRRSGEGYVISPRKETKIDGKAISDVAPLGDGVLIELGEGVRLRFRRPHPLSASARLEFASRHRTQPPVDGVILMAESLVLGPAANSHVVCRNWPRNVVLFHQQGELHCRTSGALEIDGVVLDGRGGLNRNSTVRGEEFSLSLEEVVSG